MPALKIFPLSAEAAACATPTACDMNRNKRIYVESRIPCHRCMSAVPQRFLLHIRWR